jgi:hypothetical protein
MLGSYKLKSPLFLKWSSHIVNWWEGSYTPKLLVETYWEDEESMLYEQMNWSCNLFYHINKYFIFNEVILRINKNDLKKQSQILKLVSTNHRKHKTQATCFQLYIVQI